MMINGILKDKRMKLIIISILLILIINSCMPVGPSDNRSKEDIMDKWEMYKPTYNASAYEEEPSVEYPYSIGSLNSNFIEDGVNMSNFIRYLAGLPDNLESTEELNEKAQYGAVLLSASSDFSHYPSKPNDMSDEFYNKGLESTSSSNISYGYYKLWDSVMNGYMRDDDSSNIDRVGHRRWVLNPELKYIGFGFADDYSTMQVFDKSGAYFSYDYVLWPNEGYFPKEFFDSNDPWSISVNPDVYETPRESEVSITLRRNYDGREWVLNNDDSFLSETGEYFNIDTGGYGIRNCIIFRPDTSEISKDWRDPNIEGDVFEVEISGVYYKNSDVSDLITYEVHFFRMEDYIKYEFVEQKKTTKIGTDRPEINNIK